MGSMSNINFKDHGVINFTPAEITATGARLEDVRLQTFVCLQHFRNAIGSPVRLIRNGLTTGDHKAKEHRDGLAVDFTVDTDNINEILAQLISAGFRGIGLYWNGSAYSFHADLRTKLTIWQGTKSRLMPSWLYTKVSFDPRN